MADDILKDIQDSIAELNEPEVEATQALEVEAPEVEATQAPEVETGRERDANGRFTAKSDTQTEETATDETQTQTAAPSAPPPGWSVKSKTDWANLPQHIRDDIVKREQEVNNGFAQLRDYRDLRPYAEQARRSGTTLSRALEQYTRIEGILNSNFEAGLAVLCQNQGMTEAQAGQLFAKLAQKYGAQAPAAAGQEADPIRDVLSPFLTPLQQELTNLRQQINLREQAHQRASEESLVTAIDAFSRDPANLYFNDLAETISRLFESGMVEITGNHSQDLRAAYNMAMWHHPEVRQTLIDQQINGRQAKSVEAVNKAKQASKSVGSGRAPATVITDERPGGKSGADDILADVRAAYAGARSA